MSYSAIIFDLGNVVLTNDWHFDCSEKFQAFEDYFDITYEEMEEGWNAAWPEYRTGETTEEEFWKKFLQEAGANELDAEKAKSLYRDYQFENEDMLNLVDRLNETHTLGVLSTIPKEWANFKEEKFNLQKRFNSIVTSGRTGLEKPNLEIYREVIDRLDEPPEKCIFIDDSKSNLPPAEELGIETIHFQNQEKLEERLKECNII
jgi:putative hydrolase of the HAD superfamily